MAELIEDKRLARLRAQAEQEMRRRLPDERPSKRHKGGSAAGGGGGAEAAAGGAGGGRFDYGAIAQLATGLTGFLVTCPLQRENSARKEAVPLLQRYLQQCGAAAAANPPAVAAGAAKEAPAAAAAAAAAAEEAPAAAAAAEEAAAPAESAGEGATEASSPQAALQPSLAAIKLACRGVVAFKLSATNPGSTGGGDGSGSSSGADDGGAAAAGLVQQAAAALLADIDGGMQPRLTHVHRIIPMQTTCRLERGALEAAGAQLAALVASGFATSADVGAAGQPRKVTFGISLKQRMLEVAGGKPGAAGASAAGTSSGKQAATAGAAAGEAFAGGAAAAGPAGAEAAEAAASGGPGPSGDVENGAPLNRGSIISTLAAGFESALRQRHACEAAVDLKTPQWVLVAEVFPASGCLYAALCALPAALCVLKPKLHIKLVGKGAA